MVSLRESSWKNEYPGIAVGDVVLLQNDSTKRVLWKLAIVKELLPGSEDYGGPLVPLLHTVKQTRS